VTEGTKKVATDDLAELVIGALERMAFVLADRVESEPTRSGLAERVAITFERQQDGVVGRVLLDADEAFIRELGASLLGMDSDEVDLDEVARPALLEFANVLGGEVVRLLGGAVEPFKLGLPELAEGGADANDAVRASFVTDERGHLEVTCVFPA
jgi:hypothetical protein